MRSASTFIIFTTLLILPLSAIAAPTINIYTDSYTYYLDDQIEISLAAQNSGGPMAVAVFIGLLTPDGQIYTLSAYGQSGWSNKIEPWIPWIDVPPAFNLDWTPFIWVQLPSAMPPIDAGAYNFAALLTYPHSFTPVSNLSIAPFNVIRGITMVSIPAGHFLMGSPSDETGRNSSEGPQRTVNISAFEISETEITERQWEDVMGWIDSRKGVNYPVENATWYDCAEFCNKMSEQEGFAKCYTITDVRYNGRHINLANVTCNFDANGYRLPTEAEWEYACRAGTTTRFHSGDADSDLDRAGWYFDNSNYSKQQVAQKQPNAWGLYDMHGNLKEWCWDMYRADYYGTRPDPDTNPRGPDSGTPSVTRGGSWYAAAQYCRSACRDNYWVGTGTSYIGFRIVRSLN
ncbi:MAG: formylglycine-generating enzyme family protein [Candidatus Coatesbacteria bacterium]|nr:formylglycine-generating enzyme family protein [Candidatus Coatesbacteria bacterium]